MKKIYFLTIFFSLLVVSTAISNAQSLSQDICHVSAIQFLSNTKSLKKIESLISRIKIQLRSISKKQATQVRKLKRSLNRYTHLLDEYGQQASGAWGFLYVPEPVIDYNYILGNLGTAPNTAVILNLSNGSTVKEVYDKFITDNGTGKFTESDYIAGTSIEYLLDIVVGKPPAVIQYKEDEDERDRILARRSQVLDIVNGDLGPKIYSLIRKRIVEVYSFLRSPLELKAIEANTKLARYYLTRDDILSKRAELLVNKRACLAAGFKWR